MKIGRKSVNCEKAEEKIGKAGIQFIHIREGKIVVDKKVRLRRGKLI